GIETALADAVGRTASMDVLRDDGRPAKRDRPEAGDIEYDEDGEAVASRRPPKARMLPVHNIGTAAPATDFVMKQAMAATAEAMVNRLEALVDAQVRTAANRAAMDPVRQATAVMAAMPPAQSALMSAPPAAQGRF